MGRTDGRLSTLVTNQAKLSLIHCLQEKKFLPRPDAALQLYFPNNAEEVKEKKLILAD